MGGEVQTRTLVWGIWSIVWNNTLLYIFSSILIAYMVTGVDMSCHLLLVKALRKIAQYGE